MKEERLQILRLIQEGIITAQEGTKLLAALGERGRALEVPAPPPPPVGFPTFPNILTGGGRRWLRIRVTNRENAQDRINLTVPIALLDWGLRMAETSAGIRLSAVREVIQGGVEGKILEVEDNGAGERVEIFVE